MNNNKILYALISLVFIQANTSLIYTSSLDVELEQYMQATIQENENFLKDLKKANKDKAKIAKASEKHEKAIQAIRTKYSAALNDYYKIAFHPDKAKGKAWHKAKADLKKEFPQLQEYWKKIKIAEESFKDNLKALRSEYKSQLKDYEQKSSVLFKKYWN